MATITRVTTADEDSAIKVAYDRYIAQSKDTITIREFVLRVLDHWIAARVAEAKDAQRETKGELYQKATPEDQATIDAILQKYAGA